MSALGLDTSVVVRFLTGEPVALAQAARKRIGEALQDGHELVVADVVVVEAYFVLHKIYGIPKGAAVKALLGLFEQPGFREEANGVAVAALRDVAEGQARKPGMVDRMMHSRYMRECDAMLTFEKASRKLGRVEVLG